MRSTISVLVVVISALFSVTVGATAFWLALLTALYLASPLSHARAAITPAGDVSPANPSSWTSGTEAYIGNTASGALTVDGGSALLSYHGYLGYGSSATGVVNVVGSGSTWANTALEVGKDGSGLLSITNGGSVTSSVNSYLGYGSDSTGIVTVDGAGSTWTNGRYLYVGFGGTGTLNITNGGSVSVTDTTYVSYAGNFFQPSPAGAGTIDFGANGGTLTTQSLFASPAQLTGTGTINTRGLVSDIALIFDSTHAPKQTFAIQQSGLNATVNLDLSDPSNLGSLGAGYYSAGSLAIRSGIVVNSTAGYLGFNAGSTGLATVDGAGSTWATSSYLYVGIRGSGTLSIANGGRVSVGRETWVGAFAGSTGAISFGNNGGTLATQSLSASPSQFTGTGTINTRGLVSDIDLIFDSTHALKRTLMFQQSGSNVTINLDMSTNPSTNGSLGAGWRGAGSLTIQDGINVTSTYGYVGFGNGSTGVATVTGTGSTWQNSVFLMVGYFGAGTLNIVNGGAITGIGCNIGTFSGSSGAATVDGVGSTWTNGDQTLAVGYYGNGTLKITNGGSVRGGDAEIGWNAGATGVATVDGVGSTWTNTYNVSVGNRGNGTLSVTNHGSVVSKAGSIGNSANSTGVVTVDGAGSNWTSGGIDVGGNGRGTLAITRNGSVTCTNAYIGARAGSVGMVTVDGPGSTWNAGGLTVGFDGNGTLRISNGAHVDDARGGYGSGDYISFDAGSTGTVMVDGIGSAWTNNSTLYVGVGGTGILSITGGGFVNDTTGGWVGNDPTASAYVGYGSTGIVTVDGAGSAWMNSGSLYVGRGGAGTLNITNGSSVSATGATYVGNLYSNPVVPGAINFGANGGTLTTLSLFASPAQLTGTGTITTRGLVSDIDLIFDSTHALKQTFAFQQSGLNATVNLDMSDPGNLGSLGAGYYSAGSLAIRGGIIVNSTNGYLGFGIGSTGVAIVDGAGSTWANNGTLYVGYTGHGTLTVTNGGAVNNNGDFYVGRNGAGNLNITNGGVVSNKIGYIAYNGVGTSSVAVDGAASKWTNSGKLYVGFVGAGTLHIRDGGTVAAAPVGVNASSTLTLDVGYGSLLDASPYGIKNDGKVRIVAGPPPTANSQFSPIAAVGWSGNGIYEALGGTWNSSTHVFTVSQTLSSTSGAPVAVDLAQKQRVSILETAKNWTVGASFLAKTGTGKTFDFTATALNDADMTPIQTLLEPGESIQSAWNLTAAGAGYLATDPVYLSLSVPSNLSRNDVHLWKLTGATWAPFSADDLTTADGYASFTITGVNNYAVSATLPAAAWNVNADGTWQNGSNWTTTPNSPGGTNVSAILGPTITASRTVTLAAPLTLGLLTFNSAQHYTLAGSDALTMQVGSGYTAKITLSQSDAIGHVIETPLTLSSPLEIAIAPSSSLTLTGELQNPTGQTLTLSGSGTLTVAKGIATTGDINVQSGTLITPSLAADSLTIGTSSSSAVTAVPEPSTLALLLTAFLGGLLWWRRRA